MCYKADKACEVFFWSPFQLKAGGMCYGVAEAGVHVWNYFLGELTDVVGKDKLPLERLPHDILVAATRRSLRLQCRLMPSLWQYFGPYYLVKVLETCVRLQEPLVRKSRECCTSAKRVRIASAAFRYHQREDAYPVCWPAMYTKGITKFHCKPSTFFEFS